LPKAGKRLHRKRWGYSRKRGGGGSNCARLRSSKTPAQQASKKRKGVLYRICGEKREKGGETIRWRRKNRFWRLLPGAGLEEMSSAVSRREKGGKGFYNPRTAGKGIPIIKYLENQEFKEKAQHPSVCLEKKEGKSCDLSLRDLPTVRGAPKETRHGRGGTHRRLRGKKERDYLTARNEKSTRGANFLWGKKGEPISSKIPE